VNGLEVASVEEPATDLPASLKGAIRKNSQAVPARFSGSDFVGQIWPSLTLPVSPVDEDMRHPPLRSEHRWVFGQILGCGPDWKRSVGGCRGGIQRPSGSRPRAFSTRREAEFKVTFDQSTKIYY
jgi:hypothetical protein